MGSGLKQQIESVIIDIQNNECDKEKLLVVLNECLGIVNTLDQIEHLIKIKSIVKEPKPFHLQSEEYKKGSIESMND